MAAYSFNPYPPFNHRNNFEQDQVALFIDWDNLVISNYADRGSNRPDLEVLVRRAQQYGTVVVARAYAEWNSTADRLEVYKAGIEPIYAPVFHADRDLSGQTSRGKSLADPVMVTDCIDFLHLLPQVGTYVIVTGDKDMVPAVRLARLRGRRVVVIGPDYVANVLQQVSDEFIPYRFLLAQVVPTDPYTSYYQQQGFYQQQGQLPPQAGFYPPQVTPPVVPTPQPTPPPVNPNDRRNNRRISASARRTQPVAYTPPPPPQAYNRAAPPTTPIVPPYGYYPPAQPQPDFYQQPNYSLPTQPPTYPAPTAYVAPTYVAPTYAVPEPTVQSYVPPTAYTPAAPPTVQSYVPPTAYTPVSAPTVQSYVPPSTPTYHPAAVPTVQPTVSQNAPATVAVAPTVIPTPTPTPTPPTPLVTPVVSHSSKVNTSDFNEVKDAIRAIIMQRATSGRSQMRARDLKEELLRKIPNFSERRYGFSKFKALLNAVENAGILQIDQSGHILWVSAPGTPKMQFNSELDTEPTTVLPDADFEDDSDEEAVTPAVLAELEAVDQTTTDDDDTGTLDVIVELEEATLAEPDFDPEPAIILTPRPTEERTTSLVEAPIGAHREKPVRGKPSNATQIVQAIAQPRPALLEQTHFEEVIVLIDSLRSRNRWLGYELLLSNVRDYLSRHMPESEAKIQAGSILSKLLNDGIIKMAVEVHSRGARKMTVKVAHLQEDNPIVRYALESYKAAQEIATAEASVEAVANTDQTPIEGATYAQVDLEPATTDTSETSDNSSSQIEEVVEVTYEPPTQAPEPDMASTDQAPTDDFVATSSPLETQVEAQTEVQIEAQAEPLPVVESAAEAGDLAAEVIEATPIEQQPEPTMEVSQPQTQPEQLMVEGEIEPIQIQMEAEPPVATEPTHFNAESVEAPIIEAPGVEAHFGSEVQGEPNHAHQGETPAPAGGFKDTVEMDETSQPTESNGHLTYDLETGETDIEEIEESEDEPEESEATPELATPKSAVRRPRRRRTPRATAAEGTPETLA